MLAHHVLLARNPDLIGGPIELLEPDLQASREKRRELLRARIRKRRDGVRLEPPDQQGGGDRGEGQRTTV